MRACEAELWNVSGVGVGTGLDGDTTAVPEDGTGYAGADAAEDAVTVGGGPVHALASNTATIASSRVTSIPSHTTTAAEGSQRNPPASFSRIYGRVAI